MPTYVVLVNLTQKGAENIDQSPDRLEQVKEATESLGGEYRDFYMTFGQYDFVYIADLPDDEAAAHLALTYGRGGGGETETLKAFTEDEYREVITNLPE
ncbi:GYD domain-containing protein [Halalkalicoccus sp. NIPERK01]|uniref:GYD domain-containing protein n=1 Tax=Halalkalicoccus sp. NIPERK01 TaxID=3053469 RepID=UPI00256F1168|nr:GYD domain-containing protein [Halalkalicoccus sp. NIPERK01]MDL5361484.1 GYD domain-containing protein [Halalkalicoccus sp. NIPERK01]